MSDRYAQLTRLPVAGTLTKRIGLPQPVPLERGPGDITGRVRLGGEGWLAEAAAQVLAGLDVDRPRRPRQGARLRRVGHRLGGASSSCSGSSIRPCASCSRRGASS
jgi:hypothetical protein